MEARLVERLKRRAKHFFEISKVDAKKKKYDIAIFHLEQSLQLLLKSELLKRVGEFPKTHSLGELVRLVGKLSKKIEEIESENRGWISLLEDAYIGATYLGREYVKSEFDNCKKVVRKFFEALK